MGLGSCMMSLVEGLWLFFGSSMLFNPGTLTSRKGRNLKAPSFPASVCLMSALEVVPVKNDIKRCWNRFLKKELQAEH